jgi:striatin 1/3/4
MERLEDSLMNGQNGDLNTVLNTNNNNNNNNNSNGNNGQPNSSNNNNTNTSNNERSSNVSYTMPGILHYLQHEWNRYELDRQQWEVEKAELMTKISFLQGERRGQENLKNNLIRRIKMLELALKQERIKYHKLKFGVEPSNQNDLKLITSSNTQSLTSNDNGLFLNFFLFGFFFSFRD